MPLRVAAPRKVAPCPNFFAECSRRSSPAPSRGRAPPRRRPDELAALHSLSLLQAQCRSAKPRAGGPDRRPPPPAEPHQNGHREMEAIGESRLPPRRVRRGRSAVRLGWAEILSEFDRPAPLESLAGLPDGRRCRWASADSRRPGRLAVRANRPRHPRSLERGERAGANRPADGLARPRRPDRARPPRRPGPARIGTRLQLTSSRPGSARA